MGLSQPHGIGVEVVETVKILTKNGYADKKVSSTEIRSALISGDALRAKKLTDGEAI